MDKNKLEYTKADVDLICGTFLSKTGKTDDGAKIEISYSIIDYRLPDELTAKIGIINKPSD